MKASQASMRATKPAPAAAPKAALMEQPDPCTDGAVLIANHCHHLPPDDICHDPVIRMGYVCQFRPSPPPVADPAIGCSDALVIGFWVLFSMVCR